MGCINYKKVIVPALGSVATTVGVLVLKDNKSKKQLLDTTAKAVKDAVKELEVMFDGIPLSKLNEIAKQVYHGIKCTVDQYVFLVFHSTSRSGKTKFHTQMMLNDEGKLVNLGGHYPGQWRSAADEFVELFNKRFKK